MFSKKFITICLLMLFAAEFCSGADENLQDQKRQVYMLKGQLREQQHKAELAQIAKEKNGFFVGGILGSMGVDSENYTGIHPIIIGAKAGYQKYLNNYIAGLRFYGEYIGGSDFAGIIYQLGSVNLDLIADVPLVSDKSYSIGFFAGIGMGWGYFSDPIIKPALEHFGPVVNVGIAITLDVKSRIEVEMKIPPFKLDDSQKYKFSSTNLYFVSYNYLF